MLQVISMAKSNMKTILEHVHNNYNKLFKKQLCSSCFISGIILFDEKEVSCCCVNDRNNTIMIII